MNRIEPGGTVRITVPRDVGGGKGALAKVIRFDPELRNGQMRPWLVRPEGLKRILRLADDEIEPVDWIDL